MNQNESYKHFTPNNYERDLKIIDGFREYCKRIKREVGIFPEIVL